MLTDINQFISLCSTCAQTKVLQALPVGNLMPLPTPQYSWSHIATDFIAGLPKSQNNTVIMVIVNRFSKASRPIPLPGLPTALKAAELIFTHGFCFFGIPKT